MRPRLALFDIKVLMDAENSYGAGMPGLFLERFDIKGFAHLWQVAGGEKLSQQEWLFWLLHDHSNMKLRQRLLPYKTLFVHLGLQVC